MPASNVDRYQRWFEYEKDAHQKVLRSLDATPDAERSSAAFQKAVDLFAHMMAARWLWLFRFGAASEPPPELFPRDVRAETLALLAEEMHKAWSGYLDRLHEAELARTFEYNSLDGPRYRNSVEDILTQLFGHSWYHRGQIATLLRSCGSEPAATDFVFWCRELIGAEQTSDE
jgi:uncharacterized damage-inducible protein DinB